jgi:hypothetical protein
MTAVNCPMCELRFATKNERDWHLRNEHEHLHVHPPTNRPVEWPDHAAPSRVEPDVEPHLEPHADEPRGNAEADGTQEETPGH